MVKSTPLKEGLASAGRRNGCLAGRRRKGRNRKMTVEEIIQTPEYISVVNDYRDMCLWFAPADCRPQNDVQLEQILTSIERYGDLAAYKRVGRIRKWLSPDFKPRYSDGLPIHG